MAEAVSKLEIVLWNLLEGYLEDDAQELTVGEAKRISQMIRDSLRIADGPSGLEPYQVAHFVIWNCGSASRAAADRWLSSLTEKQLASLEFGDVLSALAPGLAGDIDRLADENDSLAPD